MTTSILPVAEIQSRLANATTPKEAHDIEAASKAAMAWHTEQGMYEESMACWKLYYQARRKTTELIKAGNINVIDVGWNKMQWSRRLKELSVSPEKLDEYFDDLIANRWHPSISGMLRHANDEEIDQYARYVADVRRGANGLLEKYRGRLGGRLASLLERLLEEMESE